MAHTGNTATNGVNFAWFDSFGLARDPDARAPNLPAYSMRDVAESGVDPYSDRPLTITGVAVGEGGEVAVRFNGYKDGDAGYEALGAGRLGEWKPAEGAFVGDKATWSTTWHGAGCDTNAAFFRIRAVKGQR